MPQFGEPIQRNRDMISLNKKTRAFERRCIESQYDSLSPFFEGETPLSKKDPKNSPQYWGHNLNPVNSLIGEDFTRGTYGIDKYYYYLFEVDNTLENLQAADIITKEQWL